jgi:hypothetical protein
MPTIEAKYNYLLSLLSIQDVDLCEKDACIGMPNRIYFQFNEYEVVGMSVDDVLNKLLKEKT